MTTLLLEPPSKRHALLNVVFKMAEHFVRDGLQDLHLNYPAMTIHEIEFMVDTGGQEFKSGQIDARRVQKVLNG